MKLLSWEQDEQKILDQVDSLPFSDFIVAVKNKNEGEILRKWFDYYADVFGQKSILVFDNNSDDERTLEILVDLCDKAGVVFKYPNLGYDHNVIHNTKIFRKLYEAIKRKCNYFALFDADEIITIFNGGSSVLPKNQILAKLSSVAKKTQYQGLIFCYWLMVKPGKDNIFDIQKDEKVFFSGIKNGKYFIPSEMLGDVFLSHNHSCPRDKVKYFASHEIWLLHYQQADFIRRIRVNFEKIKSRDMFLDHIQLVDVIENPSIDMLRNSQNRTASSHMNQICKISAAMKEKIDPSSNDEQKVGALFIDQHGSISFSDPQSEEVFSSYVSGFYSKHIYNYFKSDLARTFRHTRMIEICVFGQVDDSDENFIKGWVFDLSDKMPPHIGFFCNGELVHSIVLSGDDRCSVSESQVVEGGFKLDKSFLKKLIKNKLSHVRGEVLVEVKHLKSMQNLIKGKLKITV